MKLIGCISFFDDDPALVKMALLSISGCDRIIAIDGPYADWPHGGKIQSDSGLLDMVRGFPKVELIECQIPWPHQIQKRNAYLAGSPGDWYLNVDADEEFVLRNGLDWGTLKARLERLHESTSWIDLEWVNPEWSYQTGRKFFKHVPGIHYDGHHAKLADINGYPLAPSNSSDHLAGPNSGAFMDSICIVHHRQERSKDRLRKQGEYYRTRKHP